MFRSSQVAFRNASLSVVFALMLSFFSPSLGSWNVPEPATAASVDFFGEYLNFDASTMVILNGNTTSIAVGNAFLYPGAGVIEGVAVDVTVEAIAASGNRDNVNWDPSTYNQFNNASQMNQAQKDLIILYFDDGDITLRFKFWESGTVAYANSTVSGIGVELTNLVLNTYDLDVNQWVAFSGFQRYEVNSSDPVGVSNISGTNLVKFLGPSSNYSGDESFAEGRARVSYDRVSSVDVRIFAPGGSLYALQFGAGVDWQTAALFQNSFNAEPTSTDTDKFVIPGTTASLTVADFGTYSDADSNPFADVKFETSDLSDLYFFDGTSTVSPSAGSTVSVEAINSGRLSYTLPLGASSPATVSFRVGDGLTYSATVYALNLLLAQQPQVITFPEIVAAIDPSSGAFSSSATTSSTLQVTLTSNTPSVCSIHANGTDIVPLITSARSACSVTATQAGNATFASAEPVTRVFYFSNQALTFPPIGQQVYVAGGAISSSAEASSTLPVTLTSLTTAVCTVSGLDIVYVATGSCTIRAEQPGGATGSPSVTYVAAFPLVRSFSIVSGATYALTYDANTGTGTAPSNLTNVSSATVGTGSLVKPGFDFAGWNTNNSGSGTDYSTGSSITLTSNLDLFAKWVATVTFDSQGGSSVASQQYVFGQSGLNLPTSTKTGSTFAGWATSPTGAVLSGAYSSGSATLYAIWTSASGGSAPYNGPEITSITPNVVSTAGGQLIQVVGTRLGTGDHVTIGGVRVPLVASSPTGFSFVMPALSVQAWDMLYTYGGGARLTYISAITVVPVAVTPPAVVDSDPTGSVVVKPTPKPWSAMEIASKFAPGSPVINRAVRNEVILMLRKHARFATTIQCTGFTMGPTVLRVDAKLSSDRAKNVCRLIKQLRPKLNVISTKGQQELRLGGEIRRVEVRFTR